MIKRMLQTQVAVAAIRLNVFSTLKLRSFELLSCVCGVGVS